MTSRQISKDISQSRSPTNRLIHGDALQILKSLEADSVDLVCTDPPYGLGFMGAAWDKFPSQKQGSAFQDFIAATGRELVRVMKPGAFLFMAMTPRQDSLTRAIAGLADAGLRTDFTSLYWTFASGFPKAVNIGKTVDRHEKRPRHLIGRNPNSREHATRANSLYEPGTVGKTAFLTHGTHPLEGSYGGFQPKPALEVIIVAMKPLSEKTFVGQALRNRKGITWLDDCRLPSIPPATDHRAKSAPRITADQGRFPANLIVSDSVLGDYSRFFSLPFLICPKASKREKNLGLENFAPVRRADRVKTDGIGGNNPRNRSNTPRKNHHPTVKPLQLMSYLVTLGSRPGDLVLDPFLGSGTTAVAARRLDRRFIGIERERDYLNIARARIRHSCPRESN